MRSLSLIATAALTAGALVFVPGPTRAGTPAATGIGGSSELSVTGIAGNVPRRDLATGLVDHDGRFERNISAGAYGTGDAIGHWGQADAKQTATASPAGLASTGASRAEAHLATGVAVVRNTVRTGFVPDRTGTWHLELHATFAGTWCGTDGLRLQVTRDAIPLIAHRVDCSTARLDLSQDLVLQAGTRYEYVASVFEQVQEGLGAWTWDIALTPVADPRLRNVGRPTVRGVEAVGRRLAARPGAWEGAPASYDYRWLRDGKPIRGATHRTYRLRPADRGHRVSVRVTAVRGTEQVRAISRGHRVKGRP